MTTKTLQDGRQIKRSLVPDPPQGDGSPAD